MKNDKEQVVMLVIISGGNMSEGARKDQIRTKSASESYREGYDRIFGNKETNTHLN